jgi:TRAP-type mannitol/chloroaromatic compound transport system substrate-binding protein
MLVGLAPTAAMISPANPGMRIFKPKDINTLFFTSMPFGMTATEQHAWFEYGGGQELMDKVYAKHGIKSIMVLYFFKLMRNCSSLPGSCQPV